MIVGLRYANPTYGATGPPLTKGTQHETVSSMHEFDWDDEKDAVLE